MALRFTDTGKKAFCFHKISAALLGLVTFVFATYLATSFANAQTATGGTVTDITLGGQSFRVHTFTSNGTFSVTGTLPSVAYLIVGGGGGGGATYNTSNLPGSGGGAGGLLSGSTTGVTGAHTISVGNGGAGAANNSAATASNGSDSAAFGFTAVGGGGGGSRTAGTPVGTTPGNGGSGGGGSFGSLPPGTGIPGQGFDGGASEANNGTGFSGGGGGAGGIGGAALAGGNGGTGVSNSISGTAVFYAGGGGRGRPGAGGAAGTGGQGGGGDGGSLTNGGSGIPGAPNTGGGGGGGRAGSQGRGQSGGAGGSGIVILRYALSPEIEVTSSVSGALADGGTDAQGVQTAGGGMNGQGAAAAGGNVTVTYTVGNSGLAPLTLTGLPTIANLVNVDAPVSVSAQGTFPQTLAPNETFDFEVAYTPTADGTFSFDISVPNDDADEASFDITVAGNGNDIPTVVLTGPAGAQAGPFTVTATFSEPVTGLSLNAFTATNSTLGDFVAVSPSVYTLLVTPSNPGAPVTLALPANMAQDAGNAGNTASNMLNISSGALTDTQREQIRKIIVDGAARDLRRDIQANQNAVRDARDRHAVALKCQVLRSRDSLSEAALVELRVKCGSSGVSRTVPLTFDGAFQADRKATNLITNFFSETQETDGNRRIFSGDIDVSRFDGGDMTASLSARLSWERPYADDALLGYFISGSASHTTLDGSFQGTRTGYGLSGGAYFVDALSENLFWNGFAAVSLGRNDLDIRDAAVRVESDYNTSSVQFGLAVSGFKGFERFELRPEISVAYGYTDIGYVALDVSTPTSMLGDTMDAGHIDLGRVSFEPEFLVPLPTSGSVFDASTLRMTPSVTCEYLRNSSSGTECGGGLRLEWNGSARGGLRNVSIALKTEIMGSISRDSIGLNFKNEF